MDQWSRGAWLHFSDSNHKPAAATTTTTTTATIERGIDQLLHQFWMHFNQIECNSGQFIHWLHLVDLTRQLTTWLCWIRWQPPIVSLTSRSLLVKLIWSKRPINKWIEIWRMDLNGWAELIGDDRAKPSGMNMHPIKRIEDQWKCMKCGCIPAGVLCDAARNGHRCSSMHLTDNNNNNNKMMMMKKPIRLKEEGHINHKRRQQGAIYSPPSPPPPPPPPPPPLLH